MTDFTNEEVKTAQDYDLGIIAVYTVGNGQITFTNRNDPSQSYTCAFDGTNYFL